MVVLDDGSSSALLIDLDCTVLQWSRAAEEFSGWRADEMIGRDISVVVPPDRRFELVARLAALRDGRLSEPIEMTWRSRSGSEIELRVQLTPFVDVQGELVGACVLSFDNAEQVRTRRALAASEARYRALVGALTEIVLVTDANGDVVEAQPSWSRYTGQDGYASAGHGWLDAMHPDDRDEFELQWKTHTTRSEPFAVATRLLNDKIEYRHCEGRVAPMFDGVEVVEWVLALADVHDRQVADEHERQSAQRFRRVVDSNVVGVCYGVRDRILEANTSMLDMIGGSREDLAAGRLAVDDIVAPASVDTVGSSLDHVEPREFEIHRPDGSEAFVLAAGVSLEPEQGWLAVAVDVTDRKIAERESEYRAVHDPLTGLPNRSLLVDRLEHALVRCLRQDTHVGVLFCDLDHFKTINDRHGHAAGDAALESVGHRLSTFLREGDTVARTGGDEFVIVLEDLVEPDDAVRIAERVRESLAKPIEYDHESMHLTGSIGVAISNRAGDRVESLLNRADDAMYRAKQHGRNRVIVGSVGGARDDRRWVERELQRALAEETLAVAFQPLVDLRDGGPVGAEALLRWSVDGEAVSPARTIAVAEECGIITRVSDWILQAACSQFARWRRTRPEAAEWRLHINVSARDLVDDRFIERVLRNVAGGDCRPSDICLELTETAMLHHPERAHSALSTLRAAGMSVAIDDFGTGYASLGILRDVPADIVKIDQSFVSALSHSQRDRSIVQHAIELAHELGLVTVGEGVESLAQMAILSELGCDHAQGFAFARPRPVDELPVSL
jgi:diguanylate cyclase (GGDEF)-like protein/PAS domain S-box-containing protein